MQTMQDRVLSAIEAEIETAGFEPVQKANYANTGHVYAMKGLAATVDVVYQFDGDRCTITITSDMLRHVKDSPPTFRFGIGSGGAPKDNTVAYLSLKYTDAERMEQMIAMVRFACGGRRA